MLRPKLEDIEVPVLTAGRKVDRRASRRAMRASPVSACWILTLVELEIAYSMQSRSDIACAQASSANCGSRAPAFKAESPIAATQTLMKSFLSIILTSFLHKKQAFAVPKGLRR